MCYLFDKSDHTHLLVGQGGGGGGAGCIKADTKSTHLRDIDSFFLLIVIII